MSLADDLTLPGDPVTGQAVALNDLATRLMAEGKTDAAVTMLRRAIAMTPHLPHPVANLGTLLGRIGRHAEAEVMLRKAVEMAPSNASYRGNLGTFLGMIGMHQEATGHLVEADRLDPNDLAARWDLAVLRLKTGDWKNGLDGYETRFAHRGEKHYPNMPVPTWSGEDLNGRSIVVQQEQGLGDRILLSRYIAWMHKIWPDARIMTCFGDELTNLMWGFRKIGADLLPSGVPWPEADFGVWLASLPRLHGTRPDYIPVDPGLILDRVAGDGTRCQVPSPDLPSLKIGVCWTGSTAMAHNAARSIPMRLLLSLCEDSDVMLYSFQVGPGHEEFVAKSYEAVVVDLAPAITAEGWIGTALALREMDLVITVCTSIAHLAGALGVPCWVLLHQDPYWIWGGHPTSTPWYPSVRLFRQPEQDDWEGTIAAVKQSLRKVLAEWRTRL